ncbi:MAG: methyltransferase domain-containing protein [Candidatus Lokiarchaeota archaeon]|nr:methyltransferase domain-containing protein [Candidatus Lokiarchaeota archaeon]
MIFIKTIFESIMPDWDEIFREKGHVFPSPHPDFPRVVELMKQHEVRRVLDIGCGTGRHLVYLAKHDFETYGFDASPHALELAKRWLQEEDLSADVFQHRMETSFPFDDGFFDAIISIQSIHHNMMSDIRSTINEIERVTSPRSILFITVPTFQPGPVAPEDDWELRKVEPDTYIPEKGPESGIPHHYFSCIDLISEFRYFEPLEIFIDATKHRAFLGIKRSEP